MPELRIPVRVKPGSSRTLVGGRYGAGDELVVAVNAPPVDGAANDSVVKAVAKALGVRPRAVRIASGQTARSKVIAVTVADAEASEVADRYTALLGPRP
jgi:uncharacterized protein (TIGR00251 family)